MKALVCGNAPCRNLSTRSDYDIVVGCNGTQINEIPGTGFEPDVLCFWPPAFNGTDWSLKTKYVWWMPYFRFIDKIEAVSGKMPEYVMTDDDLAELLRLRGGKNPTTGLYAIWMALRAGHEVTITGYDYYKHIAEGDAIHFPHEIHLDKKLIEQWVADGTVRRI